MKAFSSLLVSSLIHLSIAVAAFKYQGPIRNEEPAVYTLDLILDDENHRIQKEDEKPKIEKISKETKTIKNKNQNTKIAKIKKQTKRIDPNRVTQKQPSPVTIVKKEKPKDETKKTIDENKSAVSKVTDLSKNHESLIKEEQINENLNKDVSVKTLSSTSETKINPTTDARLLLQKEGNIPPEYSTRDRLNRVTGKVIVLGYVDKMGDVSQVNVLENTGSIAMEENVVRAFKKYRFKENQEGWVKMPYEFVLNGESQTLSTRQRNLYQNKVR